MLMDAHPCWLLFRVHQQLLCVLCCPQEQTLTNAQLMASHPCTVPCRTVALMAGVAQQHHTGLRACIPQMTALKMRLRLYVSCSKPVQTLTLHGAGNDMQAPMQWQQRQQTAMQEQFRQVIMVQSQR